MIRTGYHNVGSKDAGGWFIIDKAPPSIKEEMKEKANLLKYDMYANEPFESYSLSYINKQFKTTYSDQFLEYVKGLILKYEEEIREDYALKISTYDFNKLETIPDVNSPWYTGEKGGWVTMQNRFEFEHPHRGYNLFNFMYWADVPYTAADKKNTSPNVYNSQQGLGQDYVTTPNNRGIITTTATHKTPAISLEHVDLETSKHSEGYICILPPYLYRGATPFYSTEEYKIVYRGELGVKKPITLV